MGWDPTVLLPWEPRADEPLGWGVPQVESTPPRVVLYGPDGKPLTKPRVPLGFRKP